MKYQHHIALDSWIPFQCHNLPVNPSDSIYYHVLFTGWLSYDIWYWCVGSSWGELATALFPTVLAGRNNTGVTGQGGGGPPGDTCTYVGLGK